MYARQQRALHQTMVALVGFTALLILAQTAGAFVDPPERQQTGEPPNRRAQGVNVLSGLVLDHKGEPVPGARVAVADAEAGFISWFDREINAFGPGESFLVFFAKRNGKRAATTTTDEEGKFEVRNLKFGEYNIAAYHRSRGAVVLGNLAFAKDSKPQKIKLDPPAYIRGTIKGLSSNDHEPTFCRLTAVGLPRNVHVSLSVINVPSEGSQRFRVGPVPTAARWTLTASQLVEAQGYSATLLEVPIVVKRGKTTKTVVDLEGGTKLSGRVRGPKGEPLSGVSVVAKPSSGPGWTYGAVTDKVGKYTIRGLPDGKYTLEANRWRKRTAPG